MAAPYILLVEDSALASDAMRVLFEETGHRVTVAATAESAIEAGLAERPDIMLLDLGLPDADGLTVLETLTARGAAPLRTVALTGDGADETIRRCRGAGCSDVMLKPVPIAELLRKIREWGKGE